MRLNKGFVKHFQENLTGFGKLILKLDRIVLIIKRCNNVLDLFSKIFDFSRVLSLIFKMSAVLNKLTL